MRVRASILPLFVLATPALAQRDQTEIRTGSRFLQPKPAELPEGKMAPVDQARGVAAQFGECVARANRPAAIKAVSYFPTDPTGNKLLGRLAMSDCLRSGELRMPEPAMRGALFMGLYRRDYGHVPPPPAPAAKIDFAQGITSRDEAADAAVVVREFIDCVVRRDPADARAAILAPVASPAESAAYASLSPHLSACLTQGTKIRLSKTILSGLIAEVAYRNAGALPNKSTK